MPLSRRRFLKSSAAAAAGAVAFPAIIPSSALGADGHTAPSERITLGFVGMGKQARGHLNNFRHNRDCQVLMLCDVERVRLELAQKETNRHYTSRHGKEYAPAAITKDFRELCARDDIDAVVISTPNQWHAIPAIEAARNGKDIYLEKPLARTIGEGMAIRDAVRRYNVVFQTGSQQRSDKAFRFAAEMVRNGRIGKVKEVFVNVGGPPVDCYLPAQPVPEGLDWDFWLGPAPYRPYHSEIAPGLDYGGWPQWRVYRDYAGGGMTDFGAHHYDIAQWGLGRDEDGPVEVHPPGEEHERLTYVYEDGIRMYHGGAKNGYAVEWVGENGRVRVNRGQRLETDPPAIMDMPTAADELHLYNSESHHGNWLDCIRSRRKPICHEGIGNSSATVCHIGNIAYWLDRALTWDPKAERFVNDEEANRLISRPMREPWRLDV